MQRIDIARAAGVSEGAIRRTERNALAKVERALRMKYPRLVKEMAPGCN